MSRTPTGGLRTTVWSLLILLLLNGNTAFSQGRQARSPGTTPEKKQPTAPTFRQLRSSLPHAYLLDRVRVFYDTTGPHAVDPTDANQNSIPDQVEDVALQSWAARVIWISLGFPDPLKGERYSDVAWIDVHMLNRETLKANGITYDEICRFNRSADPAGTRSVCFDVATSVKPTTNLTPAHEMFHVIQNGACYFKNRWYTEGTARWSEKGLGKGGLLKGEAGKVWPPDQQSLNDIYESSYDAAASYWAPLLQTTSRVRQLPPEQLPAELLQAKYVNGTPVLQDLELTGWDVVRDVLMALGRADNLVSEERKLQNWPEAEQRSPANSPIIHDVVEQVANKTLNQDK